MGVVVESFQEPPLNPNLPTSPLIQEQCHLGLDIMRPIISHSCNDTKLVPDEIIGKVAAPNPHTIGTLLVSFSYLVVALPIGTASWVMLC